MFDPSTPASRLRRRLQDREHPLGLSARLHPECIAHRPRRSSEEHHLPHRRRLWRDAADREADAGAGDVSLPLRLHREGRRHREGPCRRAAGILDLLRRAVPAAASVGRYGNLLRDYIAGTTSIAGWSIRAGPAANTASAAACRSRRRARCSRGARRFAEERRLPHRPYFGFSVPTSVAGRRAAPALSDQDLEEQRRVRQDRARTGEMFQENFAKFESQVSPACAPRRRKCGWRRSNRAPAQDQIKKAAARAAFFFVLVLDHSSRAIFLSRRLKRVFCSSLRLT